MMAILAVALALCACGSKQPPPQARTTDPTVAALDAEAAKAEAEASRLQGADAATATASPAATPGPAAPSMTLAAGDEKLHTGQYYDTIGFTAQVGQTFKIVYDTQGYQPLLIVLGPDNKPDSQSQGPVPDASGEAHLENETTADRAGTWHVLLSSMNPGETGSYRVRIDTVTTAH